MSTLPLLCVNISAKDCMEIINCRLILKKTEGSSMVSNTSRLKSVIKRLFSNVVRKVILSSELK